MPTRNLYWLIAGTALLLPTVVTWIYFVVLHGTSPLIQQSAYGVLKAVQFSLPIIAILFVARSELGSVRWLPVQEYRTQWLLAVGFGLAVALATVGVYWLILAGQPLGERLQAMISEKITSMGLATPLRFLLVSVFYAMVHSGLEEYYWRWFAYRWLRLKLSTGWANLISSLGFGLHHILLLGFFLGFDCWQTWALSAAVSVGGLFWAWLYQRTGDSIGPIWISHALVDAGIFGLGFWLIRSDLGF